jgi:hypothetical protein
MTGPNAFPGCAYPDAPPIEYDTTREAAEAHAIRWFRRGVVVGAAAMFLGFLAGMSLAGEVSISGTIVTLEPSEEPGVVAVVTMRNMSVNDDKDNGDYLVALPGLDVAFSFVWQANPITGADGITVIPPDGMVCEPLSCEAVVPEGLSGSVRLLEWLGG